MTPADTLQTAANAVPHVAPRARVDTTKSHPAVAPQLSAADSLRIKHRADSLRATTLTEGIVLTSPAPAEAPVRREPLFSLSWVTGSLLLVFCIVAIKFKNNGRYLTSLFSELFEVRERHNVFDDTVRETSFLLLLNLQWCLAAGVCLYYAVVWTAGYGFLPPGIAAAPLDPLQAPMNMALCAAVAMGYAALMAAAYYITGNVFTDARQARMWLRGFLASQGFMSVPILIVALLLLSKPEWTGGLLIAGLTALIIAKILFIWKGLRIFFTRISSWVLFLYYLCSLEIIPLILTYIAATVICASVPWS